MDVLNNKSAFRTCNPGAKSTHETIMVSSRIMAYIILEEVEFLQDGHAAQQSEQAVEPQQQAMLARDTIPPIFST